MMARLVCVVLLAALAPGLGSCFSSGGDAEPDRYYRVVIERTPPARSPLPFSVVLRPFHNDEILDREGILHQTSDVERGYWLTHEWLEPVAPMVRSAVQSDLERAGMFEAVHLYENEALADLVVTAEIHEFGEVDGADGWYGTVDITFEVNRVANGGLVWRERVRHRERAEKKNVVETVRALGRALGRASDDLMDGIATGVN
jgi:ABC-type uncharacterized transport system auxiliary subunit